MSDAWREYLSFGKFIGPIMRTHKEIKPVEECWGDKDQFFTFYKSPCALEEKLVIYINGGGWDHNSPHTHYFIGQKFAKEGYDCVMFGYRKTPRCHFQEIEDDIFQNYDRLKDYLVSKDKTYDKQVVIGSSAGAHLGALLCFDREKQAAYGIRPEEFNGLISLAGPLCFQYPHTETVEGMLKELFESEKLEDWKVGEPFAKMYPIPDFKIGVIQSRNDGLVGFEQAEAFCNKASMLGMDAEFYEVTEEDNTHSAYCIGSFLRNRSESATLDKVFEMLDKM